MRVYFQISIPKLQLGDSRLSREQSQQTFVECLLQKSHCTSPLERNSSGRVVMSQLESNLTSDLKINA